MMGTIQIYTHFGALVSIDGSRTDYFNTPDGLLHRSIKLSL